MSDPQHDPEEIIVVKMKRRDTTRLGCWISAVVDEWHAEDWDGRRDQKHDLEGAYKAIHKGLQRSDRKHYENKTGLYAATKGESA